MELKVEIPSYVSDPLFFEFALNCFQFCLVSYFQLYICSHMHKFAIQIS
jgi:hypothetical protein